MKSNKSALEKRIWQDWINNKDNDAANAIINHYSYLVNFHVERISAHLPSNVTKDDIKSLGMMGLFDALKKFEPERDLKFDTYASFRIRGAIIDGLRKEDWLPRSLRERTKKIEQVSVELEQRLHREPSSGEIAEKVGLTQTEVETLIRDSLFANVLSLEDKPRNRKNEHKEGIGYALPDETSVLPEDYMLKSEISLELQEGIKLLNDKEQMVISLFYDKELTLTEIGHVLGLTTSRISQIHKKAIFKLRKALRKLYV